MGQARENEQRSWREEGAPVRCVLLHARPDARHPRPIPEELTDLLAKRGVRTVTASSPYTALAELCAPDPQTGERAPPRS